MLNPVHTIHKYDDATIELCVFCVKCSKGAAAASAVAKVLAKCQSRVRGFDTQNSERKTHANGAKHGIHTGFKRSAGALAGSILNAN